MIKLKNLLRERLPQSVYTGIRKLGEFAERRGISAYLVGGSVRDLLLGLPPFDLDIVVEGDGIQFARDFGGHLKREILLSEMKTHSRFGTATLILKDGRKLDIVTARKETYPSPGRLPLVQPGTLLDDLYRRDFTINSIALCIQGKRFGEIEDPYEGEKDLQRGLIRILHSQSFIDDPTRVFRAVRFETRFGFRIESQTLKKLKEAIQLGMVERLTPKRKRTEFILLFQEENPSRALLRLNHLGVLRHLHPKLSFSKQSSRNFMRALEVLKNRKELQRGTPFLLFLLLLSQKMDFEERLSLSHNLALTRKEKKQLLEWQLIQGRFKRVNLSKRKEVLLSLLYLSPEILLSLYFTEKEKERKNWIEKILRNPLLLQRGISGKDLKRIGIPEGPHYQVILKEVLLERLKGRLRTKSEEIAFVKRFWQRKTIH